MNAPYPTVRLPSVCPHDCPSACALEVEVEGADRVGRIYGARDQLYTAGVICAKVARYAERIHHRDRLLHPLRRIGPKGSGAFEPISWEAAMRLIAAAFLQAEATHGAASVWPYYYAGTMGRVMRDGINRLRHVKKYSGFYSTICINPAWTGFLAGTGIMRGPDPREMAKSDLIVIWGTNPVVTQINVMTHAVHARKQRGAKIVVIDVYRTASMQQADVGVIIRPGTDGALACALMHVLFRDGHADWDYLEKFTDDPHALKQHLANRDPDWAAAITGISAAEIESLAALIGRTQRTFFRLGYGFSRSRNGAVNMHAAASIAAVTGAFAHEGGGAFHNNGAIYHWQRTLIEGLDARDPTVRNLDQSRIGAILTGDPHALFGGPPVAAMLIQNTNPLCVAPDQETVRRGFLRDDLFVAVHEHFLTDTAKMADVVLPATMFLEHDDIYSGGGHQYIMFGGKLVEAPGQCRSNHDVICDLAARLGASHPGFAMTPRQLIDQTLQDSGWGSLAELERQKWIDCQPPFSEAHFLDGFGHADGKFHFKPDWPKVPFDHNGPDGPWQSIPPMPDHWDVIENADAQHPFRLATSPARNFLNSTFNETPTSQSREGRPSVLLHPEDAAERNIADGDLVELGNRRGTVTLHAMLFDGVQKGVLVSEGVWSNSAFLDGKGINSLTGAEPVAPFGGAAFHDNHVWLRLVKARQGAEEDQLESHRVPEPSAAQ
jgi:anaerobic selenocysteine-containing dehydrogenase